MISFPHYNAWFVRVAGTQLIIYYVSWKATPFFTLQCSIRKVYPRTAHEGCAWGWVVSATPWLLYFQERDALPIVWEAERTPESVWMGAENLAHTGIQSSDCPACRELLYQLHCPGPCLISNVCDNKSKGARVVW